MIGLNPWVAIYQQPFLIYLDCSSYVLPPLICVRWLGMNEIFYCPTFDHCSHGTADSETVAAVTAVNWRAVLEWAVVCAAG